jgi:7-keto-8-aminopelargonate synthetase-like enzyme
LIAAKREHGAFLLVDEAHALGAVGPRVRGTWEAQGIDPADIDLLTGSLSKGIPSTGGFIAGSRELVFYLQHGSDPYIFSAAMPPANTAAALEALRVIDDEPERVQRLHDNAHLLRTSLAERGFDAGKSTSPVVPLLLGDAPRAFRWSRRLLDQGILASAVAWPAVGHNKARLRLCATASHTAAQIERLVDALASLREAERGQ